jgi:hypothetical protein
MQGKGELYNVVKDLAEIKNLFSDKNYENKKTGLLEDMLGLELRMQDPLPLPHPRKARHYGFKRDPENYWTPYKDEPQTKFKENLKSMKNEVEKKEVLPRSTFKNRHVCFLLYVHLLVNKKVNLSSEGLFHK